MMIKTKNHSAPAFTACALAAGLLLAGCKAGSDTASSGPSGSANPSPSAAPTQPGASVGDLSGLPSGFPSYSGTDPACRSASNAVESLGTQLGDVSDPSGAAATFATMAQQARDVAPQATSQTVTSAISALAEDYQSISDALRGGSNPDYLKVVHDATTMVKACADAG